MKILYLDMDNVLVDFESGIQQLNEEIKIQYAGKLDEVPDIFSKMKPLAGALESVEILAQYFDIYILSTAPWENPSAWKDKLMWIKKYLPKIGYKRLIISHNKNLNIGDYLVDDRTKNGAGNFTGKHIHFGQRNFENWQKVCDFLLQNK
jgi:5'(3')-deoxyribonucleotidase